MEPAEMKRTQEKKKNTHTEEKVKRRREQEKNSRKLIMQHLLPTQLAHALPLSTSASSSSSSFRILLHPFLLPSRPFSAASSGSSLLRAPPPSSHLSGERSNSSPHAERSFWAVRYTSRWVEGQKKTKHAHTHTQT